MNDQQWLTAADAAKVLKVTTHQVHRYAEHGQLADDLAVDIRPSRQQQDFWPPEMVRYLLYSGLRPTATGAGAFWPPEMVRYLLYPYML
jgi:hypothetical protein